MDDYEDTSALEEALEAIVGDKVASLAMDAREGTQFSLEEGQSWVLVIAVLIVALGGLIKNTRGGPLQTLTENWKEDQQMKREIRREFERRKLEKMNND